MKHLTTLVLFSFLFCFQTELSAQCEGTGTIFTSGPVAIGDPAELDPNGDDLITFTGARFSAGTNEIREFESLLTGGCECEQDWTHFSSGVYEPDSDIQTGGTCGNTDIISDDDGGEDHAYYTIFDRDGDCNTISDLMIAFRIRVADVASGNFSFEVLVNNDGLLGADDPHGIQCCNGAVNPGFEVEIQLALGGGMMGVNVYNVDGIIGGTSVTPDSRYDLATNANVSTACGTNSNCPSGAEPVFYTFFLPLTELGYSSCQEVLNGLSLVAVSSSSGNPVIAECNSISDVGGTDDNADNSLCADSECPTSCGTNCAVADALMCAANNFNSPLPIELLSFSGEVVRDQVELKWVTINEIDNAGFEVQRSIDGVNWKILDFVEGYGNTLEMMEYSYTDESPQTGENYYRLKQVDFDGAYEVYKTLVFNIGGKVSHEVSVFPNPVVSKGVLSFNTTQETKDSEIVIYNQLGKAVYREAITDRQTYFQVQLPDLPQGIYFTELITGQVKLTDRIIINPNK